MSQHYFNIVKRAIGFGDYELTEMLSKIESSWFEGKLSDGEKAELTELARANADPLQSFDMIKRLEAIEGRLDKLEKGGSTPTEEWPEFKLHTAYKTGDKVSFQGKKYICSLPEHTSSTTWSPRDYPGYWEAAGKGI